MNKLICLLSGVIFFFSTYCLAQKSKRELEKERQEAIQMVQETEKILQETEKKRVSSLGQLNAIINQIKASERIINTIRSEIKLINENISDLNQIIESLENDLTNLKKEYAFMAYTSYKANYGLRNLVFIFSAPTFNQMVMRTRYMDQYADARKKQLDLIREVRESLIRQRASLEDSKKEKDQLLSQEVWQNKNLINLRTKQDDVVHSLSQRETEIKQQLADHKKDISRLDKLIADIVAAEIKASSKEKSATTVNLTASQSALSKAFEGKFAKLQWPVSEGFISSKFGLNPHQIYKKLMVPNNGIDIQTSENEEVHAVFDGLVKAVAVVPGDWRYVVIVQHGDYFTVYAKLKEVFVKQGQILHTNDPIGVVNTDRNGTSEIQFQIWKNKEKLNPENWIVKK